MGLFGKKIKPLGFQYKPQYYDPAKEEREARLYAARAAAEGDPEAIKARISASFRRPRATQSNLYKAAKRRSNITVLISLIVLLALAYVLLVRFLPQLERAVQ